MSCLRERRDLALGFVPPLPLIVPMKGVDCYEKVKETIKNLTERYISCRITPYNISISIEKIEYVTYI